MPSRSRNRLGAPSRVMILQMSRKPLIKRRFSGSTLTYDHNANLQNMVAESLDRILPAMAAEHIMEVGCGTGIFTQHLIRRYPRGHFIITDISPEMVLHCLRKYNNTPNITFTVMDGDRPTPDHEFDIIASSMSLQWFDDPIESIKRQRQSLASDGRVAYATLGQDNFPEWRETLDRIGEPVGLIQMPVLPGVVFQECIQINYGSAEKFLATLRATGAHQPRPGYRPLSPSALKNACTEFNRSYAGRITWRVVYGLLGREEPL